MAETFNLITDPTKINPAGAEPSDLQEYQKSLEEQIKSLENRYAQPNLFKVAAGFAKPQLGGFLASLGSASEAIGENVEQQRAMALPIAQMRSQLAQSKIAMGQNQKAADRYAAHLATGNPVDENLVGELTRIAPDSPSTKAAAAQLATQQKSQEIGVTRAGAIGKILEEARLGGYDPRPILQNMNLSDAQIDQALKAMPKTTDVDKNKTTGFDVKASYGTPSKLLDNLANREGGTDPYAINKSSKALGNYQFTPETLVDLRKQGIKFDPLDKDESRAAADWYLQKLLKDNNGDWNKALAAYGGFKKENPSDYIKSVTNGVDLTNTKPSDVVQPTEEVGKITPSMANYVASLTPAQQQEFNKQRLEEITKYKNEQNASLEDPTYRLRIKNLTATYDLLANNPKLQSIVSRYSGADAATLAKAVLESNSFPDFISNIPRTIGSKLPTDDAKTLEDLYAYTRAAANEKLYIDRQQPNPTDKFRTTENSVAFGLGQPANDALLNITTRLHDLKLPYERAKAFNYLLSKAPVGTSLGDILENELMQHADLYHAARHQHLATKEFLKTSGGKFRNKLDLDLQPQAFNYDSSTYKVPTRKEIESFKGSQ